MWRLNRTANMQFAHALPEAVAKQPRMGVLHSGDTGKPSGCWYYLDTLAMLDFPPQL